MTEILIDCEKEQTPSQTEAFIYQIALEGAVLALAAIQKDGMNSYEL